MWKVASGKVVSTRKPVYYLVFVQDGRVTEVQRNLHYDFNAAQECADLLNRG